METANNQTVFIEYGYARKGQHIVTVVQRMNYQKHIIGRIYKEYNPEIKRTYYQAYDFLGNQIFFNTNEIGDLKNKFKKNGMLLAEGKLAHEKTQRRENAKFPINQKPARANDLKNIRDNKSERGQTKEKATENNKMSERAKLEKIEREQDEKNALQYQTQSHSTEGEKSDSKIPEKADESSSQEVNHHEEQLQEMEDEKSEREMELEEIRTGNDDREQDMEIDL